MPRRPLAVPGWIILSVGLGTAVLVALSAWPLTTWAYGDWVALSATTRESLVYAGPWAAGWCAWTAGRYLGPRSLLCSPAASSSGTPVVRAHLAWLCGAAVTGHVLGLLPVIVSTAGRATAGGLDWLVALGSTGVLLTFCALGYLTGCVIPRVASVIAAVVITFVLILFVDTWGLALAPLWLSTPAAGQQEAPVVAAFRAVFYLGFAVILAITAGRWVADRATVRGPATYATLTLLMLPVLVGATARNAAPPALRAESNPSAVCTEVQGVSVCLHRAKAALLSPLADDVNAILSTVDGKPAVPLTHIVDASLRPAPEPGLVSLELQTEQSDWQDWAAGDVAGYLTGRPACSPQGDLTGGDVDTGQGRTAVSLAFATWIARTAGFNPPQLAADQGVAPTPNNLDARSEREVAALYHEHSTELATCTLTPDALG
jgi:hypothetical protein